MGNMLFTLGALSLLLLAFVYLLGIFYPENEYLIKLKEQESINIFLLTSLASFGLGLLIRILSPVKKVFKNKCKRCGAKIPEGDLYCSTCLRDLKDLY